MDRTTHQYDEESLSNQPDVGRLSEHLVSTKTIVLPDGRILGYSECGDPNGRPLFVFHGWPGSRKDALMLAKMAEKHRFRVIAADRPGMGLSDFQPGRRFLDWPDDVIALADKLGVEKFAVWGTSGGSPYALSCAYAIPARLSGCAIVCGLGPYDPKTSTMQGPVKTIFAIARTLPWLLQPLIWLAMGRMANDPAKIKKMMARVTKKMPNQQQELFKDLGVVEFLTDSMIECFRQGSKGAALDSSLNASSWGFDLSAITLDEVFLWHGEKDINAPVAMGKAMADAIPCCKSVFYPDDDHYSVLINRKDEIMETLSRAITNG